MEELSDNEQLDAMRAWWAENGNYVLGGIAVGVICIFGWNRWQSGITNAQVEASSLYEDVMDAAGRGRLEAAAAPATTLMDDYASSPYTLNARLAMARLYMDNSRDQDAANMLQGILDAEPDKALAMVARVRLAKVFLYQGKAEEALGLVRDQPDSAFVAIYSELMGDAYANLGSYAEAEAAYVLALGDDPQAPTVDRDLIQLKLNDLPAVDEVSAAVDAAGLGLDTGAEEAAAAVEDMGSEDAGPIAVEITEGANEMVQEEIADSVPDTADADGENQ